MSVYLKFILDFDLRIFKNMSQIINLTNKTFEKEVLKSKIPVLVDFWTSWCSSCKILESILNELASELKNKLKIVKFDAGDPKNQKLVKKYQIQGIPNLQLFKNGKAVKELIGLKSKETLKKELSFVLDNI